MAISSRTGGPRWIRGEADRPSVARFIEKPNAVKAAQYLRSGNYYWNSGMFVWKAATILKELRQLPACPEQDDA